MTTEAYIESLPLSDIAMDREMELYLGEKRGVEKDADGAPSPSLEVPENLQSAVNAGSLLSFVGGISKDEVEDLIYSSQLAQRAASAKHNRFQETKKWYEAYFEVLENIGWATEHVFFSIYKQDEGDLRMDQAALEIISAVATQNQLGILKESVEALKSLADGDDPIKLFDYYSSASLSGNFQLGAVQKAENGVLSMALGAFHYKAMEKKRKFLFFSWSKEQINFWTAAQKMTFNQGLYSQVREAVKQHLGVSASDYVASLAVADA